MNETKVISIDLYADLGFFKKPFSNERLDLYLTFNMLHKPALLGILGAILGFAGYKKNEELPEYYVKLKDLKIGIEPIEEYQSKVLSEKGIFQKTTLKYNNSVGYANMQNGIPCNLIINEQIIISPAYRCYILLDNSVDNNLKFQITEYLENAYAEYLPYFGKNEFSCWWEKDSYKEYKIINKESNAIKISSIFYIKSATLKESEDMEFDISKLFDTEKPYAYFERLPIDFMKIDDGYQYRLEKFIYSNLKLKNNASIENLFHLECDDEKKYIQFF